MTSMVARRTIRMAVGNALIEAMPPEYLIETPGDWTTAPDVLPAILYRSPQDTKESIARAAPNFTTTVMIEIEARVEAVTAEGAQDAIEGLGDQIETAIFTNVDLISLISQFSTVSTNVEITSEGRRHLAGLKMTLACEVFEAFDPVSGPSVTSMGIHADLAGTYDATGTYTGTLFPGSVQAAPRTSGPDGRDEGALDITLPQ